MNRLFERGEITEHGKAAVLGYILSRCASYIEPAPYHTLFDDVMMKFDVPEEQIGGDITHACFLLHRSGMIVLSPFEISALTMVQASRRLIRHMWDDGEPEDEAA